jgi:Flp pilus assembly protein TadG
MLPFAKPEFMRKLLRLIGNETGAIGLTFALTLIPLLIIAGGAIDYARTIQYKSSLQAAVDGAALAGATAFSDSTQGATAIQVANNYFNHAILPASLHQTGATVTANANGSINPALGDAPAFTVTVKASATISTTLLSLFIPSVNISVSGTAGDPLVTPQLLFTNVNSVACDGNTVYLYEVPPKSSGSGFDFNSVPSLTGSGNYYMIGSNYKKVPTNQVLPTFTANQPLGVMLQNDTNGNTKSGCGVTVTGANSYGAPNGATQYFYSSLLQAAKSPSENTNYDYTVAVTSTKSGNSTSITAVTTTVPAGTLCTAGAPCSTPLAPSTYNILASYLGINASSTYSNCTTDAPVKSGQKTTTTYHCTTQYPTSTTSSRSNCSLYIQTGVSEGYIDGLSTNSTAPAAAIGNCFSVTGGGAEYAAPSCAQLSSLASGSGSSAIAPAAVFWWDDAGGVGPGEQYYGPASHCSGRSTNGPGYGEDCQYKNNFFAAKCTTTGGSGSGFTEVVLTQ